MIAIVFLLAFAHGVAAAAERLADFAYGMPIHADGKDALYEIKIPPALYRGVTRADLGDIRIFNGAGEVVPHALRPSEIRRIEKIVPVQLPAFPLRGATGAKADDLQVRVDKGAHGAIVSLRTKTQASPQERILVGYLLDATALKHPIQALQFNWQESAAGFVGKISVEGSDDLNAWRMVTQGAALARVNFGGFNLTQNRLELGGAKYKYLRITWPKSQKPLESLNVIAEPAAGAVAAPRLWQAINGSPMTGKTGEFSYDLGGPIPLDRLRVDLPQVNSVAQVQILARAKNSEDWRLRSTAIVYRLHREGAEVTSPEIVLSADGARQLLLRVEQKGGGIGAGVPSIHIGWTPQRLVFAARGNGPFQLAYGNRDAKPAVYGIDALIPGYRTATEFAVKPAAIGPAVALGGAARLREAVDYKKWTLWAVLVLGVLALGVMAYRLSRQVTQSSLRAPPDEKSN